MEWRYSRKTAFISGIGGVGNEGREDITLHIFARLYNTAHKLVN